jgi:DNA invertase Pin-like site-specific DNA recombinase
MGSLVGYARVSKIDQNIDKQIDALLNSGVARKNIYEEKVTSTKRDREQLNKMIDDLDPKDTVIIAELTRLSRSTKDLFEIVSKIEEKKAHIKSLKESWLDTTTPQGKLMFTIFAGLSQFERDLISQRTKEGLIAAKARGRNGGRPSKRNEKAMTIKLLYKEGIKIVDIVKQTGLSRSTVNRAVKDMITRERTANKWDGNL